MEEKVKSFLETDLLEKYVLETASHQEVLKTERYITLYPEVRKAYHNLEENLEEFAKLYATPAPESIKTKALLRIQQSKSKESRKFMRYAVAASIIAFVFAATSYVFWNKNQDLIEENVVVNQQIKSLEENFNNKLADLRNQFIVTKNPYTKKYSFKKRNKDLKAYAYVNPVKKLSYINVAKLPQIPEEQCFQIWAEVNGELVSLGLITAADDKKLMALPYSDKAITYNITVEPKGGNSSPSPNKSIGNLDLN